MADYCIYEVDKQRHIATITFNRPEKMNAAVTEDWGEFKDKINAAECDPDVKVIVFKGAGRCFGTGNDANEIGPHLGMGGPGDRRPSQRQRLHYFRNVPYGKRGFVQQVLYCEKATISQVHGYCYGGHFEIAAASDIIICSDDSSFTHPGYRMVGPLPDDMLVLFLRMGLAKTKEMMLTGRALDAQESLQVGLVNKVVPRADLDQAVADMAGVIGRQPFDAIALGKANFEIALDIAGVGTCVSFGYLAHTLQTNIRYEEGEFNLIGTRSKKGLKEALREREDMFKDSRLGK